MIANIIDKRKRPYRWKSIQAIVEAVEHDNAVEDSDQAEPGNPANYVDFDQLDGISIVEAVEWATSIDYAVTLYLYDEGSNQVG